MPASDDGGKDQANFVRVSHPFYAAPCENSHGPEQPQSRQRPAITVWGIRCFRIRFFDCDLAFTAGQTNSCSFSRTTSTGHGAVRTTRSAVLPMHKYRQLVYPWVAMIMRSTSRSLAALVISLGACPTRTNEVIECAPSLCDSAASAARSFSAIENSSSSFVNTSTASSPPIMGVAGSTTYSRAISQLNCSANRNAY